MVKTLNFGLGYGLLTISHRDHMLPLIRGVSDTCFRGFSTREKATAYYLDAKDKGFMSVIRDPGDDALFG